ncbi:MAG: hypothetical protein MHPSP_003849, partial [Paramarteilia canceri]
LNNASKVLVVTLAPLAPVKWKDLTSKRVDKIRQNKETDNRTGEMQNQLFDMMQKMYDSGDDKTKESIKEAWQKAMAEKGQHP